MAPLPLGILALAGGGVAAAYELIQTHIFTGTSSTGVTFTNISQEYKHLQLRVTNSNSNPNGEAMVLKFNGDNSSVYNNHWLRGYNGNVITGWSGGQGTSGILLDNAYSQYASAVIDITDYSNSNKNTSVQAITGANFQYGGSLLQSGLYDSTTAVSSILCSLFLGSVTAGTRVSIYGIKG